MKNSLLTIISLLMLTAFALSETREIASLTISEWTSSEYDSVSVCLKVLEHEESFALEVTIGDPTQIYKVNQKVKLSYEDASRIVQACEANDWNSAKDKSLYPDVREDYLGEKKLSYVVRYGEFGEWLPLELREHDQVLVNAFVNNQVTEVCVTELLAQLNSQGIPANLLNKDELERIFRLSSDL